MAGAGGEIIVRTAKRGFMDSLQLMVIEMNIKLRHLHEQIHTNAPRSDPTSICFPLRTFLRLLAFSGVSLTTTGKFGRSASSGYSRCE